MAEGKRPGGLTALAVLNFVFGGFAAIGALGMVALIGIANKALADKGSSLNAELAKQGTQVSTGFIYIAILLLVLSAGLLIASGVGYIKQRRVLGRTLGNLYAIVSLGSTAVSLALVHQGFSIGTLIGLVYPVLTLFLLNNTFKDDLVS